MKQNIIKLNNNEINNIESILPAIRASATKIMAKNYNLTQQKIALLLSLTQAAVSKYINNKYSAKIKKIETAFNKKTINTFVEYKINGQNKKAKQIICKLCKNSNYCKY